jgi:hypothetical protein
MVCSGQWNGAVTPPHHRLQHDLKGGHLASHYLSEQHYNVETAAALCTRAESAARTAAAFLRTASDRLRREPTSEARLTVRLCLSHAICEACNLVDLVDALDSAIR